MAEDGRARTVFFGTPAIAVPALRALCEVSRVVGVICQPDRPAGRGMRLTPPAVKVAALQLGLEVHQPVKVKTGTVDQWLRERDAQLAVVMAYGRILPPPVLAAPRLGCVNLHASLLPKYRGAAPIQRAIWAGERVTGISLMQMDAGLDTGPVFCRYELSIGADEDTAGLTERLGDLAARVVREQIPLLFAGQITAEPQDAAAATHAPPLEREESTLDFTSSAVELARQIRALSPRPGAATRLDGKRLRITAARAASLPVDGPPGTVTIWDKKRILVATGEGTLELLRAQLEGRKELPAQDLANGRVVGEGVVLG
ncbi:MAG: methionyl-tRNA formyltransferase [Polyangiaceae bacterium]